MAGVNRFRVAPYERIRNTSVLLMRGASIIAQKPPLSRSGDRRSPRKEVVCVKFCNEVWVVVKFGEEVLVLVRYCFRFRLVSLCARPASVAGASGSSGCSPERRGLGNRGSPIR